MLTTYFINSDYRPFKSLATDFNFWSSSFSFQLVFPRAKPLEQPLRLFGSETNRQTKTSQAGPVTS